MRTRRSRNGTGAIPRLSLPDGEAQARAGAGRRAVRRDVVHRAQIEMIGGCGHADPVADFRVARIEQLTRQRAERFAVLLAQRPHHFFVERFVDREMAEATRGHDTDPLVAREAPHCVAQGPAQAVAAARSRLVRREVGVEEDGHHRQLGAVQQTPMHETEGVPFALAFEQVVGHGDVELGLDEVGNDVRRQRGIDRIVLRRLGLVVAGRGVAPRSAPAGSSAARCGCWRRGRRASKAGCRCDRAPSGRRRRRSACRARPGAAARRRARHARARRRRAFRLPALAAVR